MKTPVVGQDVRPLDSLTGGRTPLEWAHGHYRPLPNRDIPQPSRPSRAHNPIEIAATVVRAGRRHPNSELQELMGMRVLVLGGTHFVGRAIATAAVARGAEVTLLNRGRTGPAVDGVARLVADRTDRRSLAAVLGDQEWDVVLDTWMGAPRVVRDGCAVLAGRVRHYRYVSSWVVYRQPVAPGADENSPVIAGDPGDEADGFYPTAKRGCELAVLEAFGDRALIARCGPTLGPYEDVGSFTWWLRRIHRGGPVLAPGNPADPLQYVDVRDLANWLVAPAEPGVGGAFNAVCPRGRCTMGELLTTMCRVTGSTAELRWVADDELAAAGVRPFLDVPLWLPGSMRGGLNDVDASAALRAGLDTSRPLADALADTWDWLRREGEPTWSTGGGRRGLTAEREAEILAQAG
jgi:2'-hydroxyisoflavone reductase